MNTRILRRRSSFVVDWQTAVLVGLMAAFQAVTAGVAQLVVSGGGQSASSGGGQEGGVQLGVEIVAIAAVEIGALLLLWRGYRRLPDHWQRRIQLVMKGFVGAVLYLVGLIVWWAFGLAWAWAIVAPLAYGALRYARGSEFKWIPFNAVAFLLGVTITLAAGFQLTPRLVIGLMIVFLVYDHIAVNLSDIMGDLVAMMFVEVDERNGPK